MKQLSDIDVDRVIEMAWEDRTPFEAILTQFGLTEQEVIDLMRTHMKRQSWVMWRKRVKGRKTKHKVLRDKDVTRFKCSRQRTISSNKIT